MNYPIDPASRVPAYLQLYNLLKTAVTDGTYPCGSRLPSKRTVAEEAGLSVVTVAHAYALLAEEGYAEARERSGYFVIYRAEDFQTEAEPDDRAGDASGQDAKERALSRRLSPYTAGDFPFSVLAKTVRRVLSDYGEELLVRSPNHGSALLREELAAYLARSRSIHVRPSQIIVGSGAEYLYGLIAQLFGPGTAFALESPSYEKIRKVYEANGIRCEMIPLLRDGIDTDALRRSKTAVLHTTPFHNYPTGITANASKKREILRWAAVSGAVIVEDNYDSELTVSAKPEDSLFSMSDAGNVIYVNTFTRTIAPSVRVGYMALPEGLEKRFNEKLGFYACPVPLLDQYVLAKLLRSGDFERHLNRTRRLKRKAPEYVTLRQRPELLKPAASWFHEKWGVPEEAYLECMEACLDGTSDYDWYLCLSGGRIVAGLGVIDNDFHDRKDLSPNVCAVFTEPAFRRQGIAGRLLDTVVEDMRSKGISPLYLVTDHTGFYERYGWEFFCMAQGDGEPEPTRLYIHR